MIFPRFVFKNGGPLDRAGGSYSTLLVASVGEYDKMLASGWFPGLLEAIAPPEQHDDDKPPTREELEAKADELGVKFDGRIGDKKLAALIETAMGV